MKHLLFSDTHWDEDPDNEYRWDTFRAVHEILDEHGDIDQIFHLGDAWDRKDRFSGQFVNRLIGELRQLGERRPLWIQKGNHDDPLHGPAFFEFLNGMVSGVRYVTHPYPLGNIILLPFTPDPMTAWRGIDFSEFRAALMHITVTGAISESGYVLTGGKLPILPRSLVLYSGDVHNPQTIRNLTYVGCPHPIKFGDRFQPRMLLIDADSMEIAEEIPTHTIRKLVAEVSSLEELQKLDLRSGDQVKVRFSLAPADIDSWGMIERDIAGWAASAGASISSTEISVDVAESRAADPEADPEILLRQFAEEDAISSELLELGLDLMREARG